MMLGTFQSCRLRLEVPASSPEIREALTSPAQVQQWIVPQELEVGLPDPFTMGLTYKSQCLGLVICHQITELSPQSFKVLLSGALEGFHHWHWGEGWVQSHLEGVSLLPLQLVHTYALWQFRSQFTTPLVRS